MLTAHRRMLLSACVIIALVLTTLTIPAANAAIRDVSPPEGPAGTRFHFQADGFEPGERVDAWATTPGGRAFPRYPSVEADDNGMIVWSWDSAPGDEAGTWVMAARGIRSDHRIAINFTVSDSPALPAPPTSVNPAQGGPGTVFNFQASGFAPRERVAAWLVQPDGTNRELVPTEMFWEFADDNGDFSWQWTVPQGAPAGNWVAVAQGIDSDLLVEISFIVLASADPSGAPAINPTAGAPGTLFIITAGGFNPNEQIGTWLNQPDGQRIDSDTPWLFADENGNVTWQWQAPGNAMGGGWQAVTRGQDQGRQITLDFVITGDNPAPAGPQVTGSVNPASGPAGTVFTFTAQGFEPGEEVAFWRTNPENVPEQTRTRTEADANGIATWTWTPSDRSLPGNWMMSAIGQSSQLTVQIYFEVTAVPGPTGQSFTITPANGPPGTTFEFTVRGYNDQEYLDTWLNTPDGRTIEGVYEVQADRDGRASWTWTAPEDAVGGRYEMVSRGVDTLIIYRMPFVVERDAPPPAPETSVSPESGAPGTTFTFTAAGYTRNELIGYWFNRPDGSILRIDREVAADSDGIATITWTAPEDAQRGEWTLVMRSSQGDARNNDVTQVIRFRIN